MKKTILLSLLALLFSLGCPQPPRPPAGDGASAPPAPSALPAESAAPAPAETPEPGSGPLFELPSTITLLAGGERLTLGLEDYLCGVVAAEMPASFPLEALKAQAVAARSYALCGAAAGKHGDAAVCADPGCCQAWLSEEALRKSWGEDYEANAQKIRAAVQATAGQILRSGGEPALAAFHSSSAGATEASAAIWSARPYLVSVPSPETAADVPGYVSTVSLWPTDFRDTLLSLRPEADFSGSPGGWIGALRRDGSGRTAEASLGGVLFSGVELRRLFSLRSTAFELAYRDGLFVFTVTGSGHGVGMSQYGAKVMAERGADYTAILAHYYPGTELAGTV